MTGQKAMAIIYVNASATGLNNGTSWENAYTSLQDGIDNCTFNGTVWVWRGVYKPTKKFGGTDARNAAFQMKSGVTVLGGFGPECPYFTDIKDFGFGEINETILSGDIGVSGDPSDNCYHVFYNADPGYSISPANVYGFTIRDGNANSLSATYPHQFMGGGVYNGPNTYVSFVNCKFYNNTAGYGGAFYGAGYGYFEHCIFNNNNAILVSSAGGVGGAIYITCMTTGAVVKFNNCLIYENTAATSGGGIAVYSADRAKRATTNIVHTTIAYNHANLAGGIRLWDYCDAQVELSIISLNTHNGTEGKNIHVSSNSTFKITCSVHFRTQKDLTGGAGVYVYAPAGSNPAFLNPAAGDFRIGGNSNAVDIMDDSMYDEGTITTDLRGQKRVQNYAPDCGCYEYTPGLDPSNNKNAAFTTDSIVLTTGSKVTVNSAITYLGETATQYGHTWNTDYIFNTSLDKTQLGTRSTLGSFSSEISGLVPGQIYYIAPYATTSVGTYYGLPQVVTIPKITSTPALINTSICTGLDNPKFELVSCQLSNDG